MPPALPTVFAYLRNERNVAVDSILCETLPVMEPSAQVAALQMLIERGHAASLAVVCGRFSRYSEELQKRILRCASGLAPGVQAALRSPVFEERGGAVELVVRSDLGRLAYLLEEALRSRCSRTRELAAAGLYQLAMSWLACALGTQSAESRRLLIGHGAGIAEALASAVRGWESHLQPKVIEAALRLGQGVEPIILRKLAEPRSRIARSLTSALATANDPALAGFVLRALAVPELRTAAAQSITRNTDGPFLRAILGEAWLLADPRIEKGCHWLQYGRWVEHAAAVVNELEHGQIGCAVHFLCSLGGAPGRRIGLLEALIESGSMPAREAAVWELVADRSEAATDLLAAVAQRPLGELARMAEIEVQKRRGVDSDAPSEELVAAVAPSAGRPRSDSRDLCRHESAPREAPARCHVARPMRRNAEAIVEFLAAGLASGDPLSRVKALRSASRLGVVQPLESWFYRCAFDADARVRSVAVGQLAVFESATARRILERAVDDPDARVQAGAIDALDRLNVPDRARWTEPKLRSTHNRVRACAVKSLLRLQCPEAGEALLAMLEDASARHRLSGLWVVEQLGLQTISERVDQLGRFDPDARIRRRAARVLSMLRGDPAAKPGSSPSRHRVGPAIAQNGGDP